jgi:RNA polymerase sigma-70 factor (ECF subfamily)
MDVERPFEQLMNKLSEGDSQAAAALWERFVQRLRSVAAARLPNVLQGKTDPESIVQSVLRSFYRRQRDGQFAFEDWDGLWSLLTLLTVRKCGHRVKYFLAAKRDARREAHPAAAADQSDAGWEPAAPEPTPSEALLLAETLDGLFQALRPQHGPILQLRLEGCTIEEISGRIGCSERTVHRVLERVRAQLEASAADNETS